MPFVGSVALSNGGSSSSTSRFILLNFCRSSSLKSGVSWACEDSWPRPEALTPRRSAVGGPVREVVVGSGEEDGGEWRSGEDWWGGGVRELGRGGREGRGGGGGGRGWREERGRGGVGWSDEGAGRVWSDSVSWVEVKYGSPTGDSLAWCMDGRLSTCVHKKMPCRSRAHDVI